MEPSKKHINNCDELLPASYYGTNILNTNKLWLARLGFQLLEGAMASKCLSCYTKFSLLFTTTQ